MSDYFVGTKLEADSLVSALNIYMGYPDELNKTYRYAIPREHASKKGEFLVVIKDVFSRHIGRRVLGPDIKSRMSTKLLNSIKDRETLESEGAFKTEEL